MEMNKDEAEKCLELGRKFLRAGDYAKAIKFLDKSLRLYPLPGVVELKARAEAESQRKEAASSSNSSSSSSSNSNNTNSSARRRHSSANSGVGDAAQQSGRHYTEDQVIACRAILAAKKKGHYEVLSVTRTSTDDEIKKSYRRLALKFHPDKNAAPEADEAFKAIGTAFAVLSDADKRRTYDQFGDEEGPQMSQSGNQPFRGADISPEEIFNMFFGMQGGAGPGGFRVYRTDGQRGHPFHTAFNQRYGRDGQQQNRQGHQQNPMGLMSQLLQMLPVILLLFLSFFSFPQGSERVFSLHPTDSHRTMRETSVERVVPNIKYYVANSFQKDYARDRRKLFQVEREVQNAFMYDLQRKCELERSNQMRLKMAANRIYNREERQKKLAEAEALPMQHCEDFRRFMYG